MIRSPLPLVSGRRPGSLPVGRLWARSGVCGPRQRRRMFMRPPQKLRLNDTFQ